MIGTLYIQSQYAMLKNTIPLKTLVETAKAGGYDFLALSDEQLYGMMSLYELSKQHQIKPVLGMHVRLPYDLYEMDFLIYVKDEIGYQNILKISLLKSQNNLTFEDLKANQQGLIFVTGKHGLLNRLILEGALDHALDHMILFKQTFDDLYLGLSLDQMDEEILIAPKLKQLSQDAKLLLLPIHQTSYLYESQKEVYKALIKIEDESNDIKADESFHFLDEKALMKHFSDYQEVFKNLDQFIKKIVFEYKPKPFELPTYDIKGADSKAYLKSLAIKGLKKRLANVKTSHDVYQERLLYELDVIHDMGFDHYFLIVFDFVRYAKTHDILVGPGRGSAAGSLVAYCLGITDIDPIVYDLLFERFLNPERITMPDIDMDFPDNKRDEVIRYVQEKYGKNHMIQIITFGTFALRSSIRDIARVMKIDLQRVNAIIKRVLNDQVDPSDEETMRLLDVAKQIEGLPRHTGTHAAGMILAKQDLTKLIPLQQSTESFYQSQFEAGVLEKLGLLKIDFLGIRNLQIIHDVVQMIEVDNPNFKLKDIPLDDVKTYQLLSQAQTEGVFQLESSGMKNVLRKLKPNHFEDIIAILALFRPGPMDHIDDYIERRAGKPYTHIHPKLSEILDSTYGIIIYQEQIMRIAHEFAGYTLAEADILRRGVSKKNKEILENERVRFIDKCLSKNYDQKIAEDIYDLIVKFANYGFNRSHSVAYSMVAYQMAYLKANHYQKFMTVLLSNVIGNNQTVYGYITDLKQHQIEVLPPDLNISTDRFVVKDDLIYCPLTQIKSIGKSVVEKIIEARGDMPFKDFSDVKTRLDKIITERNLENLIHSGALDFLNLNHHTMIEHRKTEHTGYEMYITDFKMKIYEEYPFMTLAENEKEAVGFNLVYHPLKRFQSFIKSNNLQTLSEVKDLKVAKVLGFIVRKKVIKTKQDKHMAFITIDDGQTQLEATLFSSTYLKYQEILDDQVKVFELKENIYNDKVTYIVDKIYTVKEEADD